MAQPATSIAFLTTQSAIALTSHKLKSDSSGRYSCSIDYRNRILFKFVTNPESGEEEILLLTLGSHDDVY
ncbi:MAG: hypothetical protein V7L31_08365 [Nostoc sp.]|uniref:hypothetical protein n=1 Tax=Nostoc sp. TaxID=1180 RepID=UPI002FEF7468